MRTLPRRAASFAAFALFGSGFLNSARTQTPPEPQAPLPPFLRVIRHEEVKLARSPARTLHTWYMESRNAGTVEARIWYIAEGRATLRDQYLLEWDKKMPTELWRLQMLEQGAPNPTLLPSYELTTLFDNPAGKPTSTASGLTGFAGLDARRTERLPAALNAVSTANTSSGVGITANRPFFFYVAQSRPQFGDMTTARMMRGDDPNPVESLTKQSRTQGKVFLVLSVVWKPVQDKPTPSN